MSFQTLSVDTWYSWHLFLPTSLSLYFASTALHYKTCKRYFPVLFRATRLAEQTTSLHKPLPKTTLCCKTCKKYFPALLCITNLAQSTSQYYFVLQSLHKVLPSTTLSTKLAKRTSQYYLAVQGFHKEVPSTPCPPIVLAQGFCRKKLELLHTEVFLHGEAFTPRSFWHTEISDREAFGH